MVSVNRSFEVHVPRAEVVAYLRDFANATEWDPGTRSCTRVGDGPVAVGARWTNVSHFAGRDTTLTYELRVDEPAHLVFTGSNDSVTSTDDLTFTDNVTGTATGTTVVYEAHLELHGVVKLAAPAIQLMFNGIADKTVEQMRTVINARSATS
jgi:carbon monoxide dehydrogenase subunit G